MIFKLILSLLGRIAALGSSARCGLLLPVAWSVWVFVCLCNGHDCEPCNKWLNSRIGRIARRRRHLANTMAAAMQLCATITVAITDLDFDSRRVTVMTRTLASYHDRRSVGSKAGVEPDGRTRPIALPCPLTRSITEDILARNLSIRDQARS